MKSRGRWWLAVAILAAGALPPSPGEADAHAYVRPGWRHTCAQLGSDQIVCWGGNNSGQLGNGSYADSSAPTTVATLHGVVDADASVEHTCAVTGDGAAWCWGSNEWGHLGDGTTQPRAAPARMRDMHGGFLSGVTEVSLGYYHTCMRAEGGVWCAGRNELGQLGHGAATDAPEPYASPVPGVNDAIEISAGFDHACAVRNDGTVWCWGRNDHGQLGFSTTTLCVLGTQRIPCALSPGQVSGLTDIVHVDAGASHTCALRGDGAVFCWGDGSSGQLGRLPDRGGVTPVAVLTDATSVRAGARHSCAILRDGIVLCWGANAAGQIGNGLIGSWSPPTPALIAPNVVEVVAGGRHTCARRYDNSVWCWGDNSGGQLGYDTSPLTFSARPVATPLTAP